MGCFKSCFLMQAMTQTADKVSDQAVPMTEKVTGKIEEKAAQVRVDCLRNKAVSLSVAFRYCISTSPRPQACTLHGIMHRLSWRKHP